MAYDAVTKTKIDSGTTFAYTSYAVRNHVNKAHENLRVLDENGKPLTRESRDSSEHPESTPIVIGFDVTGSMGENPAILQKSLKGLFGMLVRKDVVSDPQVAIAGYGDTHCDYVPVQFSQFESDNRIDDNLDDVYIEHGGGGNMGETSTALVWFVANHVVTDAWEKRGKKGYLFLVGDECALDVSAEQSKEFLGEEQGHKITPEEAFALAAERWEIYFLLVDNYSAKMQHSKEKYEKLIGKDHVITLQSTEAAPAITAAVIGLAEETASDDTIVADLVDAGFDRSIAVVAADAVGGISEVVADGEYGDLGL